MTDEQTGQLIQKVDDIAADVGEIKDCLFGNGQPGLKVAVTNHSNFISGCKKAIWIVVTGAVGIVLAVIFL